MSVCSIGRAVRIIVGEGRCQGRWPRAKRRDSARVFGPFLPTSSAPSRSAPGLAQRPPAPRPAPLRAAPLRPPVVTGCLRSAPQRTADRLPTSYSTPGARLGLAPLRVPPGAGGPGGGSPASQAVRLLKGQLQELAQGGEQSRQTWFQPRPGFQASGPLAPWSTSHPTPCWVPAGEACTPSSARPSLPERAAVPRESPPAPSGAGC